MKLILLTLCAITTMTFGALQEANFSTPLDYFRPTDGRRVDFRYTMNVDYYIDDGPLFFYLNDAGQFTTEWIERGLIADLAMELGGALFTANLRYFRENIPTETASIEDLQYLSLEHLLKDVAVLINAARERVESNGKIFVWGTGLGGTLAALARQKFPNIIAGAWSSDGQFLSSVFTNTVYLSMADNIQEVGSNECGDRVAEAFSQINQLILDQDDNTLVEEFGICRPFNISNNMDVGLFSEGIIDQISLHFDNYHHLGVQSFCRAMSVIPSDPMRSLSRWIRFLFNVDVGTCSNYDYAGLIQWTSDINWNTPGTASGRRQTLYLQCTQLGSLRTTTSTGMFGNRVTQEFRQRLCQDSFGENYNFDQLYLSVEYLNIMYGGQNPNVQRVFYTNGYLNKWISHGVTQTVVDNSFVVNIPGYSRWADLTSLNTADSIVLYNAKSSVRDTFKQWLE